MKGCLATISHPVDYELLIWVSWVPRRQLTNTFRYIPRWPAIDQNPVIPLRWLQCVPRKWNCLVENNAIIEERQHLANEQSQVDWAPPGVGDLRSIQGELILRLLLRQFQRILLNVSSPRRASSSTRQLTSRRFFVKVLALFETRKKALSEKIGLTDTQYLPVANQEKWFKRSGAACVVGYRLCSAEWGLFAWRTTIHACYQISRVLDPNLVF